jgi:hypothetical protein
MTDQKTPHVFEAVNDVLKELAVEGIAKTRTNVQQKYRFRGIDDVYNALSAAMARAGLVIVPTYSERAVVERKSQGGGALFLVTMKGEFAMFSLRDGTRFPQTVTTYGEAMDSSDKATNKAMSAAYKYAAMQFFCIPTEGDNDADFSTHTVAAEADAASAPSAAPRAKASQAKRDGVYEAFAKAVDEAEHLADVAEIWRKTDIAAWPEAWHHLADDKISGRFVESMQLVDTSEIDDWVLAHDESLSSLSQAAQANIKSERRRRLAEAAKRVSQSEPEATTAHNPLRAG